jgi:branched-chain amino acid transport system ATP-binding protein
MAMLRVENLTKTFGGITALSNLSFDVSSGEKVGIIGPNGAGKTTLFENITGFQHPTKGKIFFNKECINLLGPHRIRSLGIGRTFQIEEAFPSFTCYEVVLAAALSYFPIREAHRLADRILESFGLGGKKNNYPKNMTAFERKSLQIARMAAAPLKLVLLDEIMAGLSVTEIQQVIEFIEHLNGNEKNTFVIIEHILPVVMTLCNRIVVLDFGEKIAEGTPREIAQNQRVIDAYLGKEINVGP